MYVFGGGNYVPKYHGVNDVWCSEDGEHWTQLTEHAGWSPRLWFSSVVYRDHIWMLGGWSNNPSKNWGDVWYSKDGKDWKPLKFRNAEYAREEVEQVEGEEERQQRKGIYYKMQQVNDFM